ncbi:MAG: thermonuclease family protein [Ignavibacteriales bacterium]
MRKSLDFLKTDSFQCDVVWVIYGDMFYCQLSDREIEKIKLIGVEVPKLVEEKATGFTKSLLKRGTLVKLEFDKETRDSYGHILAYVYLPGGKMLNSLLIGEGYAQVVINSSDVRYKDLFLNLQKEAKEQGKGLWGIK